MMVPKLSYTIWFTQRCGSTWLCDLLINLGNAGKPGEHLGFPDKRAVIDHYKASKPNDILVKIYDAGSTENGVFGIKQGYSEPRFTNVVSAISADTSAGRASPSIAIWETMFPNHRHIFLTRRNKLRLAVSWWKAIQTGQGRRRQGEEVREVGLTNAYNNHALISLLAQAVAREAGISEFLSAAGVVPLTVVYEDLAIDPNRELSRIMDHLGLPFDGIPHSTYEVMADDLSEEWVQRLRSELQQGWENKGW